MLVIAKGRVCSAFSVGPVESLRSLIRAPNKKKAMGGADFVEARLRAIGAPDREQARPHIRPLLSMACGMFSLKTADGSWVSRYPVAPCVRGLPTTLHRFFP